MRFAVAFLMESGTKLIGPSLRNAAKRGAQIQILTGTYLSVTEPSAIYHLLNLLGTSVDIRLFQDKVVPSIRSHTSLIIMMTPMHQRFMSVPQIYLPRLWARSVE